MATSLPVGRMWAPKLSRHLGFWRRSAHADRLPLLAARRSPLADLDLGRTLAEDGWVTVPLLDQASVDVLRNGYEEHHGWEGEGFEPDPANADLEYRRCTSAKIDRVLSPALSTVFDGWKPFMRSFYCKWPKGESIHLHWDWTCVDENAGHRTYQVWVALQDVDERNGQMWVVPRSHRVDGRPRGTNLLLPLAPELETVHEELRDRLVGVPLMAGEAMIFDMGLVHVSTPNFSADPRLAVVVALRQEGVPLTYYRSDGHQRALRYDVDEAWFGTSVAPGLVDSLPDREVIEVVDLEQPSDVQARIQALLGEVPVAARRFRAVDDAFHPQVAT